MNNYTITDIGELIKDNAYVGRGIVTGLSQSGKYACVAYFIMGRSENSRNRVFKMEDGALFTKPFDESLSRTAPMARIPLPRPSAAWKSWRSSPWRTVAWTWRP